MSTPMVAEFTLLDGNPISVNLALVEAWQPSDEHTLIRFGDGRCEVVEESYDTVSEVLNPERQAGC